MSGAALHTLQIWLLNFAWIGGAMLAIYSLWRLRHREDLRPALRLFLSRRRVRISLLAIALYAVVGLADQIRIPDAAAIRSPTLLDLAFSAVPRENGYSAPLAAVTLRDGAALKAPRRHLLGTDINGYDVLLQLGKGSGTALILALTTTAISIPIGVVLGMLAGWYGGRSDDLIQWLYTTVASIPWLLFVIAFLMVFGRGLFWIALAIGLTSWTSLARLIRGETFKLRELEYVTAARSIGVPTLQILWRHILPNLSYLIIITSALFASNVILAESVLTFIGIGVEPGTASWGVMLIEAQQELTRSPPVWWIFFASSFLGILPLVLALNLCGDALRDALDVRLQ